MQEKEKKTVKQVLKDLRDKVKSSSTMLLVGIDVGKTRHCACFMVSSGKVLRRKFFFTNTIDGFNKLLRQAKFYQKKESLPRVLFGMESSGQYWIQLYEFLDLQGKRAVTVSPLAVRRNRETIDVSRDKSDPKDAYNVVDLIYQGKFYLPIYRDKQIRQLKRLMQVYHKLMQQKASLRCRLRGVVGYIFPELERYFCDITAKSMVLILENFPFPQWIRKLERKEFTCFLVKRNPRLSWKRAEEIYDLAGRSVGIKGEEEAVFLEIKLLLDELKRTNENIALINTKVNSIVGEREDYALLLTIPGIGPATAAGIIAEIGDIFNFSSGRQLVKLAGFDLCGAQSGTSINTLRHISKRGRKTLRTVLYQAVVSCIRCSSHLRACYLRILANQPNKKKVKPKAMVAIACKLLRIMYRMLTEKKAFNPNYDRILRERFSLKACKVA